MKKSNTQINLISILGIGLVAYFLYEYFYQKKQIKSLNQKLDREILEKQGFSEQLIQWRSAYLNQSAWNQELSKRILNPEDSIKEIIEKLQILNSQVFNKSEGFSKEISDAIHSLNGNRLHLSFPVIAKIIENLLEFSFLEDEKFSLKYEQKLKKGPQHLNLGNFITFAKEQGYFTADNLHFLIDVNNLRKDSVHEIFPQTNKILLISCHLKAIEVIEEIVFSSWFEPSILEMTTSVRMEELDVIA